MALSPGERVQLITQLADRFVEMDYATMDLHLRQFSLPWSERWQGDQRSYALHMLEQGADPNLLGLHEHLFGFSGVAGHDLQPDFWLPGAFRLFLSHVSANKVYVAQLSRDLARYGISGFVAHEDIQPTREWVEEIERALFSCDALIAVLSPGFQESNWTDQEVGFCHGRRVLIISVRAGLDPYGFISRYQAVRGHELDTRAVASELYRILVAHQKTSARMAEALVSQFEASNSFAEAKHNVALLSDVQAWTPELLRRIDEAVQNNDQNRYAWGVPTQIDALLRQNRAAGLTRPQPPEPPPAFEDETEDFPF